MFSMSSRPSISSKAPGQFPTFVVSVSCPPCVIPVITVTSIFARAAYMAAVHPAGPVPRIINSVSFVFVILVYFLLFS